MKYIPKVIEENVNVSSTSPIKDFFILLAGMLSVIFCLYIISGFFIDKLVAVMPFSVQERIENSFGNNYNKLFSTSISKDNIESEKKVQKILDFLSDSKKLPDYKEFKVRIINNPEVNAGALPGGNIIVTSGLLKEVNSDAELAFILAHELGHYAHRDHLTSIGRRLILITFSSVLLGSDNSITDFFTNSIEGFEMKHSQKQEILADLWAVDLLYDKYGNADHSTIFFEKLSKKEKSNKYIYFFATHPHPEDRIKAIKSHIIKSYRR